MTQDVNSITSTLEAAAKALENVIIPLVVIELVWLWRNRRMDRARVKEMLANLSSLLIILPAGAVGVVLWDKVFDWIGSSLPYWIPTTWATALLCVVVVDLIYYAEHRFEHTHRLPWDLYHSVHHSSPQFDQTTGLRLSGFDALLTLGFLTPAVLIGFHPLLALTSYGVVVGYQTWIHTEVIKKVPAWFEFVFNTPSHHRVHHGANAAYLDRNYGGILILWDRLFGTFASESEQPVYGLTTQIESSNPLDVQFSEIRSLIKDLRNDTGWADRVRRLVKPPGWQPASAAGTPSELGRV